ncbi:MAG: cbb3-type cytochrome c oxidase subunit I [Actinomycetota bacterium]
MTATIDYPQPDQPPEPGPTVTRARRTSFLVDIPGVTAADLRPIKWQLYLSLVGLLLGALMGILQALERLDVDLYDEVPLETYYQGLTIHGVALALVFTFCFGNAFCSLMTMKAYGKPLPSRALSQASTWLAWGGVALATWAMLANKATVLFTFYAPLQATPAFYIGAVFLVLATWAVLINLVLAQRRFRAEHPKDRTPLLAYTSLATYVMWFIASLGIAIEVLAFLLPWSLGLIDEVDPQFTRTLFWFTGHPIVYFWLLPIYISWYQLLPRQVGARTWSDGLTRMVFLAFLLLIPVGVHHQFTDPGIPFTSKAIMWVLTVAIFYPSTVTLFSVVSSLEQGGRAHGGTGLLGWILKLPWGNPSVSGQLLAGIGFMFGGASGFINANYTTNLVVHNTSFIVGHFHLTVGTAVALSIMAISYWMVPYLTGNELQHRRLAVAQGWLWFVGVLTFSRGQMMGGIEGMPRRTLINSAPYLEDNPSWEMANTLTGIGGSVMFLSAVLFFFVILRTIFTNRAAVGVMQIPVAEVTHGPRPSWRILDQLGIWALVAVVLSLLIYGELVVHYWPINPVSGGATLW